MPPSISTSTNIGLNTSIAIETVDEVDLAGFDESIRAIIFPKSESAVHSLRLQGNEGVISPITNSARLLSPCEDEAHDAIRNSGQNAILLEQSREKEKFTLGASLDNDVVLEHIDSDSPDQDLCYINLVHVQLYPDPDHDALILYNSSTSTFIFRSLTIPRGDNNILPFQETRLGRGSWQLSFGKGLDFQIKVVSRHPKETHQSWSLISPPPTPIKHSTETVRGALRKNENVPPPPHVSTAKEGSERKKIGTDIVGIGLQNSGSRTSSASMQISPAQREIIFKTPRTLVYKATRKNTIVAIKICRGPRLKDSAQSWRNELEILTRLDHPSIARLVSYDASDLRLELEYVGPDLSTFVDENKMSKLSEDIQYKVWVDVSSGLEYVHAQKILHLDIKPQNILLGQDRQAKICDFGFSIQYNVEQNVFYCGGTPSYIPPEYIPNGKLGRAADVWALGITMLFVLGLIPLPDGKWQIADTPREGTEAQRKMLNWVDQVERIIECIPDTLFPLRQMLIMNPRNRITPSQLVSDLPAMPRVEAASGELLV